MPGAEGERRLDLDRKVVRPDRSLVMDAVDEEASGPNRLQPVERGLDPVLLLQAREGGALGLGADDRPDELAQGVGVGLVREIGLERPAPPPASKAATAVSPGSKTSPRSSVACRAEASSVASRITWVGRFGCRPSSMRRLSTAGRRRKPDGGARPQRRLRRPRNCGALSSPDAVLVGRSVLRNSSRRSWIEAMTRPIGTPISTSTASVS